MLIGERSRRATNVFEALVENSQEFIALAHLDGRVIYINGAGRRFVGLTALDDVQLTRISDYLPVDRVDEAAEHLRVLLEDRSLEWRIRISQPRDGRAPAGPL